MERLQSEISVVDSEVPASSPQKQSPSKKTEVKKPVSSTQKAVNLKKEIAAIAMQRTNYRKD